MSDGLTESRREEAAANRILDAADELAEALDEVHDAAFGYAALTIEIVNDALRRVGVELVTVRRR